jgi:glycosyltransferase involved in cell wall biosynthesis
VKILLLAPHPFFQQRGTPIAERMLLEVLSAHGHQVDVLTFPEGEDVTLPGCRILRIPRPPFVRNIRPGFSLKKLACDAVMLAQALVLARRHRYDLIHAVEESAFIALAARKLLGTPYVYDMDSGLARQMSDKFPALLRVRRLLEGSEALAVRGAVGVLAVCKSLEDQARACAPGGLVARIEDVSLLADAGDEADDVPQGGPVLMYVGNLETYQGIDLLVDAFRLAVAEVPDARLAIIGGSETGVAACRARCAALGLGDRVWLAGPRPVERLAAYLRRATVLVSPRIHGDNTPMKVYSYLDSGRPLLATRLPTHTQVLTDELACLVEPTPEAMARGLVNLLRDAGLRERLAATAREYAQRELTREAFGRKVVRFYEAVEERVRAEDPHPPSPSPTRTPIPRERGGLDGVVPPLPGGRECVWERGLGGEGPGEAGAPAMGEGVRG